MTMMTEQEKGNYIALNDLFAGVVGHSHDTDIPI